MSTAFPGRPAGPDFSFRGANPADLVYCQFFVSGNLFPVQVENIFLFENFPFDSLKFGNYEQQAVRS